MIITFILKILLGKLASAANNIEVLSDLSEVKGFIVAHVNCRSILPKIDFLRNELMSKPVDVLCLSETWLKAAIPDAMIHVDGYSLFRLDRTVQMDGRVKAGGGNWYVYQ